MIAAEDLRDSVQFEVRRDVRQELPGIELAHTSPTRSAHSGGNAEHIGIRGHGRERCIGILEDELSVGVLLPGGRHGLTAERDVVHRNSPTCQ
jgi:hypothetical protein